MVLTVIGMMRCIYYLFTPDWSSYVVVLLWLSMNSYCLLMAIFFILGRPMQRLSDRFKMEATATINVDDEIYTFDVYDVSEHGFVYFQRFPIIYQRKKRIS